MSDIVSACRVALRAPDLIDAPALFALIDQDRDHLRTWLPWVDKTLSIADSRQFLAGVLEGRRDGAPCRHWLIEADGELAGCIDLHALSGQHRHGSLGYWLASRCSGRGVMTQAVSQVLDIAFGEMGLHRVALVAGAANHRSRAVASRLDFALEGVMREYLHLHDRYFDASLYSMLASQWAARR
ncbi:GNAT family N-acetyltransferase [Chromobacterium sp. IIBBL 290-4]|uniref:GNAT family N-acetyltransferase n=1 Tax=Chromobacterium sp. IIBBL 290-4 TaxID=2953890 RepID=UPI0020B6F22C|nr:GNAT family protein [Chromobacterium sp. IIBBL 290-4]UTH74794.1 GNAT family N-acetyltransferase [Chromobacterium sp. IIBBL 290-4]